MSRFAGEPPFDQDASVCSHDFFVRCSAPNDAWYQCVKCHGSVSGTSKRLVDQTPRADCDALAREAKLGAAREALQSTASTLRKLATTGGYCQELVNAAAEVESIFDWLYLPKQGGQYE